MLIFHRENTLQGFKTLFLNNLRPNINPKKIVASTLGEKTSHNYINYIGFQNQELDINMRLFAIGLD